MIGRIISVRISPAVKTLSPVVCGAPKSGDESERAVKSRLDVGLDKRRENDRRPRSRR